MGCFKCSKDKQKEGGPSLQLPSIEDIAEEVATGRVGAAVEAREAGIKGFATMEDLIDPEATNGTCQGWVEGAEANQKPFILIRFAWYYMGWEEVQRQK
eukprot:1156511-Pelagomonas_calceolata.AAC.5